jgi:hypothetical protein
MTRILLPQLGTGLLDTLKNPYERRCKRLRLAGLRDGKYCDPFAGLPYWIEQLRTNRPAAMTAPPLKKKAQPAQQLA